MSNELKEKFTKGEWYTTTDGDSEGIKRVLVNYPHGFLCSANVIKVDDTRRKNESWLNMRERTRQARIDAAIESNANQYLIAAAPDMYRELKTVRDLVSKLAESGFSDVALLDELFITHHGRTLALKKAVGEQ